MDPSSPWSVCPSKTSRVTGSSRSTNRPAISDAACTALRTWSRSRVAKIRHPTWRSSAATSSDRTGEIQLTDGLRHLLRSRPIYAYEIEGVRHDTGTKLGFLKALVYFALRRPDLAEPFRKYLETV